MTYKPLSSLIGTLHPEADRSCKRCVINASSEEEPEHFLIYHYITIYDRTQSVAFSNKNLHSKKSITKNQVKGRMRMAKHSHSDHIRS